MTKELLKQMVSFLRLFSKNNGCSLCNCHAHEIVSAFFGYGSRAALLSDGQFNFVVPDKSEYFIKQRIKELEPSPVDFPKVSLVDTELHDILKCILENRGNVDNR